MSDEKDLFESAVYYSLTEDNELLSYEDPEEAICCEGGGTPDPEGCTVYAYARCQPSEEDLRRTALEMAAMLSEHFANEWGPDNGLGDPDGGDNGFDEEALNDIADSLVPVLKAKAEEHGEPWLCVKVAERKYSAEEVAKILEEAL